VQPSGLSERVHYELNHPKDGNILYLAYFHSLNQMLSLQPTHVSSGITNTGLFWEYALPRPLIDDDNKNLLMNMNHDVTPS